MNPPANAGDTRAVGSIPRWGEAPLEEEMATHSCILSMEGCVDRRAWWATVHGVAKEVDTTERALMCTHTHTHAHDFQDLSS